MDQRKQDSKGDEALQILKELGKNQEIINKLRVEQQDKIVYAIDKTTEISKEI